MTRANSTPKPPRKAEFLISYGGAQITMYTMAEVCELQRVLAAMTAEIAQSGPVAWGEFFGYPEFRRRRLGIIKVAYKVGTPIKRLRDAS